MKCPICEKDVELQKKQVGVDEQGAPIFHQYAICRDCKKQWDLDKQRARKAGQKPASAALSPEKKVKQEPTAAEQPSEKKVNKIPVSAAAPLEGKEGKTPIPKEQPSEKKVNQKPDSKEQPSEKKVNQKPDSTELPSEKKVIKKPVSAEPTFKGKPGKKPVSSEPVSEKKVLKKPASTESSSEGKPNKKPVSPESTSERKPNRRPASASSGPAGENTGKSAPVGSPSKRPVSVKPASEKEASGRPASENTPGRKPSSEKPAMKKGQPTSGNRNAAASSSGQPRRVSAKKGGTAFGEQRYGNIPPDRVRAKKEHAVRKAYEDMLSTDPNYKPPKRKKSVPEDGRTSAKSGRPESVRQRPHTKAYLEEQYEEDNETEYEEVNVRFRIPRIIFGIISIVAAGFFAYGGFFTGLDGIASGGTASAGIAFVVYGICMLVSGLILIIMQNKNSILAFILPMLAYFGGAVFTFLNRKDDSMLLYCSVAGVVLGIIFLILGIVSRNAGSDDSEDYNDPFEDDYE